MKHITFKWSTFEGSTEVFSLAFGIYDVMLLIVYVIAFLIKTMKSRENYECWKILYAFKANNFNNELKR